MPRMPENMVDGGFLYQFFLPVLNSLHIVPESGFIQPYTQAPSAPSARGQACVEIVSNFRGSVGKATACGRGRKPVFPNRPLPLSRSQWCALTHLRIRAHTQRTGEHNVCTAPSYDMYSGGYTNRVRGCDFHVFVYQRECVNVCMRCECACTHTHTAGERESLKDEVYRCNHDVKFIRLR